MKRHLVKIANTMLAPVGVQIYRAGCDMESVLRRMSRTDHGIASILDLGAARGHWSQMALRLFPGARVIGVDPLAEREPYLARLKSKYPARYDYLIAAAGREDGGTVELAVTENLDESTVHGRIGGLRRVSGHSLDGIVAMKGLTGPFFLKFDTHGFERPILDGAEKTLRSTHYIVMEAYNFRHSPDTMLFHEMIAHLETKGFRVFNLVDILQRAQDGALWQIDLFFARADDPIFGSDSYRHG